jgi:hypothetical protein
VLDDRKVDEENHLVVRIERKMECDTNVMKKKEGSESKGNGVGVGECDLC